MPTHMHSFFFFFFLFFSLSFAHSLLDYGAIPNNDDTSTCWDNSKVILKTLTVANSSNDRVVLVPANYSFCYFYIEAYNLFNVTLQIEGTLIISNNITAWPKQLNHTLASFYFYGCSYITIQGGGKIEGQGYDWWWYVIITTQDNRPHMVMFEKSQNIIINGPFFSNSPQYHFLLWDVSDVHIEDIDQQQLLKDNLLLDEEGIPIFPLNTDGIDPAGINVFIKNVRIENFDDAVAVKPLNGLNYYSPCSQNITIIDSFVKYGVGMTIGSVPPHNNTNCIKNVLFENIEFTNPFKAIYVKTNPGWSGDGLIQNITYRNITATNSIWYPIWIGPQQEHQPGRPGTGCAFTFPLDTNCSTQPRVTVTGIMLEDIVLIDGHTLPGVLLCNETNPCTNFQFTNVKNTGDWEIQDDYYCSFVSGSSINSYPSPPCLTSNNINNKPKKV